MGKDPTIRVSTLCLGNSFLEYEFFFFLRHLLSVYFEPGINSRLFTSILMLSSLQDEGENIPFFQRKNGGS